MFLIQDLCFDLQNSLPSTLQETPLTDRLQFPIHHQSPVAWSSASVLPLSPWNLLSLSPSIRHPPPHLFPFLKCVSYQASIKGLQRGGRKVEVHRSETQRTRVNSKSSVPQLPCSLRATVNHRRNTAHCSFTPGRPILYIPKWTEGLF